jgi:hypothetical protein
MAVCTTVMTPPAVIRLYLRRFRRDKAAASHDLVHAGRLVGLQVGGNFTLNHVALRCRTFAMSIEADSTLVPYLAARYT